MLTIISFILTFISIYTLNKSTTGSLLELIAAVFTTIFGVIFLTNLMFLLFNYFKY